MKFDYVPDKKRLNVFGTDSVKDIAEVKRLIGKKKIPADIQAIVYRKTKNSKICLIVRGVHLENLLRKEETQTVVPITNAPRHGIRDILKQINEANTRQGIYAGMLIASLESKRFLFFQPRGQEWQLLGDNPEIDEAPREAACRIAKAEIGLGVDIENTIPLMPLEFNETTYYSFLAFVQDEFAPKVTSRMAGWQWAEHGDLKKLKLYKPIAALFEKDKTLLRLVKPDIDFAALIGDILDPK